MTEKDSKQVPEFTLKLRADDSMAVGTMKNRMRLLTLPGDQKEYDKLKAVSKEFEEYKPGEPGKKE